jgi:hypothetical protein
MTNVTNYPLVKVGELEKIARDLTTDTLKDFYPSWYTEHWVNFESGNGTDLTFRFERPGYVGTLVGSGKETHYFGSTRTQESASLETSLVKKNPKLKIHNDSSSQPIRETVEKLLGGKRITDVSVMMGDNQTADYVKVTVDDGSYGVVAFLPGTLIAVEYSGKDGRKVYGVEGKEIAHRRLNLMASVATGQDVIYTDPNTIRGAKVFTIPDFSKTTQKPEQKKLPHKK